MIHSVSHSCLMQQTISQPCHNTVSCWQNEAVLRAVDVITVNCEAPLGLESGAIPDSDITASSAYDFGIVGPQHGRSVHCHIYRTKYKDFVFITQKSFHLSFYMKFRKQDVYNDFVLEFTALLDGVALHIYTFEHDLRYGLGQWFLTCGARGGSRLS